MLHLRDLYIYSFPFPLPLSADCSIVVLMDQMQTSGSALIQAKLDLHKRYLMIHVCFQYFHWFAIIACMCFNAQDFPKTRKEQDL